MQKWQTVRGIIKQGHQVASGMAKDSPYPRGTIEMQTGASHLCNEYKYLER